MGAKLSLFKSCQYKKPKDYVLSQKQIQEIFNPAAQLIDSIESSSGYAYFTPDQQQYYEELLKIEPPPPEILTPCEWKTSNLLGQGSFGRVLFAANTETGVLMAVKQIPISGTHFEDEVSVSFIQDIQAIRSEIEILSQLSHKNIVRYYGTTQDKDNLNIFLEYVSGGTIANLIRRYGKFNENLVRVYTRHILEGLEYLHYHNIIHRDIKGANVLVTSDGICKLADFGASKRIVSLVGKTEFKSLRGTINWMAPEVIKQEGYGRFADIWSLGCTMIEMITGKPPWAEIKNPIAVFLHVGATNEPPKLPNDLSEAAKDFILSCFKRDPRDRLNVYQMLRHPFIIGGYSFTRTPGGDLDQVMRFETNIDPQMFEINIEEETVHENSQSHWSDSENFNEALSDLNPEKNLKDQYKLKLSERKLETETQNDCPYINEEDECPDIIIGRLSMEVGSSEEEDSSDSDCN